MKVASVEFLFSDDVLKRHTGNTLAVQDGVSLVDLKARMGHDSVRAAMIYQHAAAEADQKIANMLDQRMREARDDARDQG